MPVTRVVYGPPGCGKTWTLEQIVAERVGTSGLHTPATTAVISFSRRAAEDVIARLSAKLGVPADRETWRYGGTMHSVCARLIGHTGTPIEGWFDSRAAKTFSLSSAWDLEVDYRGEVKGQSADLYRALQWRRARLRTDELVPFPLRRGELDAFARDYDAFKRQRDLFDHTDVLERVLELELVPPVTLCMIDEAQDLNPLQIAIVQMWAQAYVPVVIAGDDDQAIYSFRGAEPKWLVDLEHSGALITKLSQSHRVPQAPHALAQSLIVRNRERVRKDYAAKPEAGLVDYASAYEQAAEYAAQTGGDVYWLARSNHTLAPAERALQALGVPYVRPDNKGGVPQPGSKLHSALHAAQMLARDEPVGMRELADLVYYVPASPWLVRGAKKRIQDEARAPAGEGVLRLYPAEFERWGLAPLVDGLRERGLTEPLQRLDVDRREYLRRVLTVDGALPEPSVKLMTIHRSKGGEADHVVLDLSITRAVDQTLALGAREEERRVWYVGITRSRQRLTLLRPWDASRTIDLGCA